MSIKIYNSLTRKKEEFIPLKKDHVGIYVCGPTVYDEPHIGHLRSAYIFDVIRRYLSYKGYKVTFVRNVTDVDDKIINKAKEEYPGEDINEAIKRVSVKYLDSYHQAMETFGIMPPDKEPKATEYIERMKIFIQQLIKQGVAYESGGDVYFDIKKAQRYGRLSNQSLEAMEAGARVSPGENKKDPLDFALWKQAKEGEPSWPSPWGDGRPGWHIECSVMSSEILGDEFDIHGGGLDLIFPHHENELAQSEGAGKKFARYWLHNGLLTINGQKMAKSAGNFVTVKDVLSKYPADVLKLFFLTAHYSQPIDFTWDIMEDKRNMFRRIMIFLKNVKGREKNKDFLIKTDLTKKISLEELNKNIEDCKKDFEKYMNADFDMPQAVAIFFEIINVCNKILYDVNFTNAYLPILTDARKTIEKFGSIFRLLFEEGPLSMPEKEIESIVNIRERLRKEKMFDKADVIRKELEEKGIILEDTKDGPKWGRKV